ncbi:MAG TPA: isoprenylcysteine carboxylmethyltransferase family protein [Bryobacteraceae bacterium]|jgi:protein-S-isoprenylcysteine O-methyltransferase Ste14|nr:isoprenylcysteine carboxylmethyltransferase family protein [Bryobacteraceae bacterium]
MNKTQKRVILIACLSAAIGARLAMRAKSGGSGAPLDYFAGIPLAWLRYDPAFSTLWPFEAAAAILFVAFTVYWEAAAGNSAQNRASESNSSRGLHVFLANAALFLVILPISGLGRYLPASPYIMGAGVALEASGLAFAIWARRHLGANWSGRVTIKQGHELIRSGPYRRLRHPIYTGIIAMYVGAAIVTGEWLAVIGIVLIVVAYLRKLRLEETTLEGAFGPAYQAYRCETSALFPGLY